MEVSVDWVHFLYVKRLKNLHSQKKFKYSEPKNYEIEVLVLKNADMYLLEVVVVVKIYGKLIREIVLF